MPGGEAAEVGLGLDGNDLRDGVGVVAEVDAVSGTDFENGASQSGEEVTTVLGRATPVGEPREPRVEAGEDRAPLFLAHGWRTAVGTSGGAIRVSSASPEPALLHVLFE